MHQHRARSRLYRRRSLQANASGRRGHLRMTSSPTAIMTCNMVCKNFKLNFMDPHFIVQILDDVRGHRAGGSGEHFPSRVFSEHKKTARSASCFDSSALLLDGILLYVSQYVDLPLKITILFEFSIPAHHFSSLSSQHRFEFRI